MEVKLLLYIRSMTEELTHYNNTLENTNILKR